MRVAFGVDEPTDVSRLWRSHLTDGGHEVVGLVEDRPWPEVGRQVGAAVAEGRADVGVVCCWTGTGVSIAANKVRGVRAALCVDAETATGARRWNDANVVALSLRQTSEQLGREILDAFLGSEVDPAELGTVRSVEDEA